MSFLFYFVDFVNSMDSFSDNKTLIFYANSQLMLTQYSMLIINVKQFNQLFFN